MRKPTLSAVRSFAVHLGVLLALFAWFSTGACSSGLPNDAEPVGSRGQEVFVNGGFESGTDNTPPPSWTITTYLNYGVTLQTPQTRAGLNLAAGGNARTFTLVTAAGPETQTDPTLGAAASFRWPKFGNAVAIVNRQGTNRNVNSMKQTMTVSAGDIDGVDGLAHVRFVLAPVLQDPSHPPAQQPYFFVQLTNITKGNEILYQDFNFANQPGVPWKAVLTTRYTDWALVDIAPGSAKLNIGDQVELELIAAGCSQTGHWGHLYVDGAGTTVPGLFVSGTGPAAANQNTDITYTLNYKNAGTGAAAGVVVAFNTPPNTTYTSLNAPGLTCTAPAPGATGLVSCSVGALPAGGTGSFQITVHINAGATGTITAGNYSIYGTNISPLLGPKIYTTITSGVTYCDLVVTKTDGLTNVVWGQPITYTIVVTNKGPSAVVGATVTDPVAANFANMAWTCAGTGGGTCTATGTGAINDTVGLPVNAKVTYTVTGNVAAGTGTGTLFNVATAKVPAGAADTTPADNSAGDSDSIFVANGGACTQNNQCISNVCDPADSKCGWADGHGPCAQANGATICRSGTCSVSGNCMPTGGCLVDADCTAAQFCDTAAKACVAKLANGTAIPTIAGHTPVLDGTCSAAVGTAVCASGVCDATDNKCGLANGSGTCDGTNGATICRSGVCDTADGKCGLDLGHGPCTPANGATICRSGACSTSGTCMPAGGCLVDGDCQATQFCDTAAKACVPKLANGTAIPTIAGHTPVLDGTCSAAVGTAVCLSGVCDTTDNKCGLANGSGTCDGTNGATVCRSGVCDTADGKCGYDVGHGPCDSTNAATVCRSGACSVSKVCAPAGGCVVDGDCQATQFCDTSAKTCVAKLANGTTIPTIAGHDPVLDGTCTAAVGTAVCQSGVCDTADNKCGYANGHGPCTAQNAATVCRSGLCMGGLCSDGDAGVDAADAAGDAAGDAAKDAVGDTAKDAADAAKDAVADAAKDGADAAKDGADAAKDGAGGATDGAVSADAAGDGAAGAAPAPGDVPAGSSDSGGCACRTTSRSTSPAGLLLFALALMLAIRRRVR
jgi:uncharacterized repeat protein (TIGR01451 family)/MYXO-CTERM domain-containing protein